MELIELSQTKFHARLMAREGVRIAVSAASQTVTRLVSNAYWERAWIFQEVILGQQVFLWYGSAGELNLDNVARIYTFLAILRHADQNRYKPLLAGLRELFEKGHYFNRFLKLRYEDPFNGKYNRRTVREPLRDLLEETSTTFCSDVRDKIYAFLNLALDRDRYGITPDYSKPPADLFYDLIIISHNSQRFYEYNHTDFEFCRTLRSSLHLSYVELIASSRPVDLGGSALKSIDAYSGLKAKLAWLLQKGAVSPPSPVILVGPLFKMNSTSDNRQSIAKHSVEQFLAALTAGLRWPKVKLHEDSNFHKLLCRLETEDVFITFCQDAPVALYHLGQAKDPLPTVCVQQKVSAALAPRGIARYILDQVLVDKDGTLTMEWNEIVQRSIVTSRLGFHMTTC